jgi:hypothetical protein
VSADASDNFGVLGVQFLLDGTPLQNEDSESPYTINWDTTLTPDGTHTLAAVARDGAGLTRTSTAISVTVNNNRPPVLNAIGNQSVNEGQLVKFTISASDPEGDELTYSASDLPSGAGFNPDTHTFSWTPGFDQAGFYSTTLAVTDGRLSDSETIIITVVDMPAPDFVITRVWGPVAAVIGTKVPVYASFKNQGNRSARGSYYMSFHLSQDQVITKEDPILGTYYTYLGGMPPGYSFTKYKYVTIPNLPPGTYYLGAIADSTNRFKESDESNNSSGGNRVTIQ